MKVLKSKIEHRLNIIKHNTEKDAYKEFCKEEKNLVCKPSNRTTRCD